jgi:fumarylacetoacetase
LTNAGRNPITLAVGENEKGPAEQRSFLEDGDIVSLRGWCEKPGRARIGFGESQGQVLPAIQA